MNVCLLGKLTHKNSEDNNATPNTIVYNNTQHIYIYIYIYI